MGRVLAVLGIAMLAAVAAAAPAAAQPTPPDPASEAFRAAAQRRAEGDLPAAAEAFARVADQHPASPWADDARMEAALAAEQLGRFADARAHLERLLADFPDSRLERRARARLAQIVEATGERGEWAAVAAEHDAILREAAGAEDPTPSIERLEALVRQHPRYPRAHDVRMFIADGWLRQGDGARALAWYRQAEAAAAAPEERFHAAKAIADAQVTHGELDEAAAIYRRLRAAPGADRRALDEAEAALAQARTRARIALAAWISLALLVAAALAMLRRDTGSFRATARALARPPVEVLYLAPVAALLVAGSLTGNRIVASAVMWIAGAGFALAWLSGVGLDQARRRGPLRAGRVAAHILAAALAVASVAYLAVMRDRLIDMIVETWRHGHDSR